MVQPYTQNPEDFWFKLIPLLIAFVAVFVAPLIQLWIARGQRGIAEKQIYASVRSSNRQAWINSLREEVAKYLSLMQEVAALHADGEIPKGSPAKSKLDQLMFDAGGVFAIIQLRINPSENLHKELLAALNSVNFSAQKNLGAFNADRSRSVEIAQTIFREEWKRVKMGQ